MQCQWRLVPAWPGDTCSLACWWCCSALTARGEVTACSKSSCRGTQPQQRRRNISVSALFTLRRREVGVMDNDGLRRPQRKLSLLCGDAVEVLAASGVQNQAVSVHCFVLVNERYLTFEQCFVCIAVAEARRAQLVLCAGSKQVKCLRVALCSRPQIEHTILGIYCSLLPCTFTTIPIGLAPDTRSTVCLTFVRLIYITC